MTGKQSTKITIDLKDEELYKLLKHSAVDSNIPVREIIVAALRSYLEQRELDG